MIIERYYTRLTLDFHTNKRICDEIARIPSKKLRNKIAGFTTHLMKRIQAGPVRGISIKLQEEVRPPFAAASHGPTAAPPPRRPVAPLPRCPAASCGPVRLLLPSRR